MLFIEGFEPYPYPSICQVLKQEKKRKFSCRNNKSKNMAQRIIFFTKLCFVNGGS